MESSLRILIVEDNRINQMLLKTPLQKLGHAVEVANNGREAVSAVSSNDFDVVLMDIQMPVMDGVEAARQIRLLPSPRGATPIVAVTADNVKEHRERYIQAGINDMIPKPINWVTLLSAISLHAPS